MKDVLFIINPKSGRKSKASIPDLIEKNLDKERFVYSIAETGYPAHACELTRDAIENGADIIVAVGGDGTVNEVARTIAGTETALGILPCGSGNGFARHLSIPMDMKKAIEFINISEPTAVDYGKINGVPFFCTCGMGFDALVSKSFSEGRHRGLIGYINETLHDYLKYKPEVYEIEDESGKTSIKAFLIACGNAAQYGNNFYIAPRASMKDGLLSITVLEPFSAIDVPEIISQVLENKIDRNSHIKTFKSNRIRIHRKKAGVVHFDGEPMEMGAELLIEIVPAGLNVLSVPGWQGQYIPKPIYKTVFEMI